MCAYSLFILRIQAHVACMQTKLRKRRILKCIQANCLRIFKLTVYVFLRRIITSQLFSPYAMRTVKKPQTFHRNYKQRNLLSPSDILICSKVQCCGVRQWFNHQATTYALHYILRRH